MGTSIFVQCGWPEEKLPRVIKVGYARDVRRRLALLQTGNPFEMNLLAVLHDVPPSTERLYHRELAGYRFRGEWFRFEIPVKALISSIAGGARPLVSSEIRYHMALLTSDQQKALTHIRARLERRILQMEKPCDIKFRQA